MQAYFGLVLLACWVVFISYWVYSAPKAKPTVSSQHRGMNILWRLGVIFIAIILSATRPPSMFVVPSEVNPWWGVVGCLCAVVGIAIAVWARYHLGRNWGMPMTVRENPELVTSGPYKWIRNPIYTGVLLALLGSVFVSGMWWSLIFITGAAYFVFSLLQEEKVMLKEFPDTYPAYKARTWRLIPFVF